MGKGTSETLPQHWSAWASSPASQVRIRRQGGGDAEVPRAAHSRVCTWPPGEVASKARCSADLGA